LFSSRIRFSIARQHAVHAERDIVMTALFIVVVIHAALGEYSYLSELKKVK